MLTRVGVPVESEAEPSASAPEPTTLLCFSHLRWNFVFQRPQHLMCRFAREMPVVFWEEPETIGAKETAFLQVREADVPNVRIVVPHLPEGMSEDAREATLKRLLDAHVAAIRGPLVTWYYTPMMLPFSRHIEADATVYDAMDELSKFKFAPGFRPQGDIAAAVSNGGMIDMRTVPAREVSAAVNSGGLIEVGSPAELSAAVNSGGAIRYRGNPDLSMAVASGGSVERAQ